MTHQWFASSIAAAVILTACASNSTPLAELTMTKAVLDPTLFNRGAEGATLLVKRDRGGYTRSGCVYRLSLDGKPFADVAYGEAVLIYPSIGDHIVSLTMPQSLCNTTGDSEISIAVKPNASTLLRITSLPDGRAVLQPTAL
jgi:hypothetical protein